MMPVHVADMCKPDCTKFGMQKYGTSSTEANMLVIGLTGNIGSGKSEVARILERNGIPVIVSDQIARQIMDTDEEVRMLLQQRFGSAVVPDGAPVNRQLLAARIFGTDPETIEHRQFVERCVHPRVLDRIAAMLDGLAAQQTPLVVVESALIYQAGIEELFDYIVAVVAPESLRRERVRQRGISDADFLHRQQVQLSDDELAARADFVLVNDGSLVDLERATQALIAMLAALPPRPVEHDHRSIQ